MPRRKQVNPKPLKRQREEAEELLRKVNETSSPATEGEDGVQKGKDKEPQAAGKPEQADRQPPKRQRIGTRSASKDSNNTKQETAKTKKVSPKIESEVTKASQNGRKAPKKAPGKGRGKGRGRGQRQPKVATKIPSPKINHDENSLDQFEFADEDSKSGKECEKEIIEKPKSKTVVSEKPSPKRVKEPIKSSPEGNNGDKQDIATVQAEPEEQANMTDSERHARNEALEALLQITDSELNKMGRSPGAVQAPLPPQVIPISAQQIIGQRLHPAESPAAVTMATGVLRAVHDGRGDVQYQVRSEAVEQQALKLLYTKQAGVAESHMLYRASKMGKGDMMETLRQEELAKQDKKQKKAGRHVCPYCGRGCAKPSVLKKHIRSHTGERPYPCVPCGFAFKTKSNLYKHRKSHAHALKAGLVTNPDGSKIEAMDDIIDDGVDTTDSEDDSDETAEAKIADATDHAQKLLISNMQIPSSYAMPVHMSVSSAGNNSDDPGFSEGLASKMRVNYPSPQPNQSQPVYFVPGREGGQVGQVQMHPDKFVLIQPTASQVPSGLPVNMPVHMRPAVQTLAQTVRERLAAKSQENLADKSRQEALRQRRMAISNLSPLPPLKTSNFGNMMSLSMSSLPDVGQQSTPTSMVPRQQAVRTMSSPLTPSSKSISMSNVTNKEPSQPSQRSLDRESLHERIMQLINQNEAIVESQSLENVKPRRMSGSRRSSIESPKPTSMGYLDLMKKSSPEVNVSQQLSSQGIQGRRGSLGNLSEMQSLGAGIPPMTPVTTMSFSLSPSPSMGLVAIATTAPVSPLVATTGFIATPSSNSSSGGSSPVVQLPPFTQRAEVLHTQATKQATMKQTFEKGSSPHGKVVEPHSSCTQVSTTITSIQTVSSTTAATSSIAAQGGSETGGSMIKELLLSRGRIQTEIKKVTERDLPKHPNYANPLELQTSVRMIQKEDRVLHSPKKRKLYEEMQAKAQRQAAASLQQSGSQAAIDGPPLKIFFEEGRVLSPNVRENSPHYATSATNMAARPAEGSSTPVQQQGPPFLVTTTSQSASVETGQKQRSELEPTPQKETKHQLCEKTILYAKSDTFSQLPSENLPPKKKLLYAGMHSPNPEARLTAGDGTGDSDMKKGPGNVLQPLQSLYRLANIKDPPAAFMTKSDAPGTVVDSNTAVPLPTQAIEKGQETIGHTLKPEQHAQTISEKGNNLQNHAQQGKGLLPLTVPAQQSLSVGTGESISSSHLSNSTGTAPMMMDTGQQCNQAMTFDRVVTVPAAGQHYALFAANNKRAGLAEAGQHNSPQGGVLAQERKPLPQSPSHASQNKKEGPVGTRVPMQKIDETQGAGQQFQAVGFPGPSGQLMLYAGQLSQRREQALKHPGQGGEAYSQHEALPPNMQNKVIKSEEHLQSSSGQQSKSTTHSSEDVQRERQGSLPRADTNTSTRHRVPYVTFERGKENIVVINVPAPAPPREMQSMKLEQTGNIIKANIMPGAGGQQRMLVQMALPLGGQSVPTNQSSLISPSLQGIGMGQRQQKVAMARAQMQGANAAIKPDQVGKTIEVMASLQPVALLTFCTLHRPQPIHLEQGSNQSVSMYAKWNIVPSSIDVRGNLSLYNSQVNKRKYRRGITTVANSTQPRGGILTPSSFWSSRRKAKATQPAVQVKGQTQPIKEETAAQANEGSTSEGDVSESRKKLKEAIRAKNEPLRVKIFDGGYKSNEDYVYVRGRGRGKYVCEDCGIRCKKPSMLKKHIRTHTDVRPYHCKYCNFSFKTKGNLTKHMKSKAHSKKCLETGVPVEDGAVDDTGEETASSTGQDAGVEEHQFSDAETTDSAEDEETESENENDDDEEEEEVVEIRGGEEGLSQGSVAMNPSSIQGASLFSVYPHSLYTGATSSIGLSTIYGKSVSLAQNATPLASPPASLPAPEELSKTVQKTVRDLEGKGDSPKSKESGKLDLLTEALKAGTKPATMPAPLMIGSTQPSMGFLGLTQSLKQPQTSVIPPASIQLPPPQPLEQRTPEKPSSATPEVSSPLPPVLTPQKLFPQGPPLPSPLLLSPPPLLDKHGYVTSQIISANQPLPRGRAGKTAMPRKSEDSVVPAQLSAGKGHPVLSSRPATVVEERNVQKEPTVQKMSSSVHPMYKQEPYNAVEIDRPVPVAHTEGQVKVGSTEPKVKVEMATKHAEYEKMAVDAITQQEDGSKKDVDALQHNVEREKAFEGGAPQGSHSNVQVDNNGLAKVVVRQDGQVEEIHTCHLCKRAFQWGRMLKEHMRAHVEERPFTCKECAVSFRTKGHLSKHERSQTHHLKVEADAQFMEWNEVEVVDSTNDPRPFKCKECKVAFRIPGHLAKHLRSKGHAYAVERQERITQLDSGNALQVSPGTVKPSLHQCTADVDMQKSKGIGLKEVIQHRDANTVTGLQSDTKSSEPHANIESKKDVTVRGRIRSISETEAEKLGREKHLFERFSRERTISETEAYAPQMRIAAGMVPLQISTTSMAPAGHYILPQTSGQILQHLPGVVYAQTQPMSPRLAKTHIPIQPALPTNSPGVRAVLQPSVAIVPQMMTADGKAAIVGTPVSMPSTLSVQPLLIPQESTQQRNPAGPGQPQLLPRMTAPGLLMPVPPHHLQTPSPAVSSNAPGAQHRLQMISLAKGAVPFIVTAPPISPISPGAPSSMNIHNAPSATLGNISPGSYSPQSSDLAARTCPHCKRSFKSARYVSKHIQTRHSSVKNFKCPYEGCEKEYAIKESYKYHISTHERDSHRQAAIEQEESVQRHRMMSESTDSGKEKEHRKEEGLENMQTDPEQVGRSVKSDVSQQEESTSQKVGEDGRNKSEAKTLEGTDSKETDRTESHLRIDEDNSASGEQESGTKDSSSLSDDAIKDSDNLTTLESTKERKVLTKSVERKLGSKEETDTGVVASAGSRQVAQGVKQGVETRGKRKLREQVTGKLSSPKSKKKESGKSPPTNTAAKKLSDRKKVRADTDSLKGGTLKIKTAVTDSHKGEAKSSKDTLKSKQATESEDCDNKDERVQENESKSE